MEFASPAWSPWTEADKAVLEKIQCRAVGMVSGLKGQSYEEKLLELNLPSLEERRLQADMVQTFKIVKGIDRVDHRTWFQLAADGGRATRSADCPLNLSWNFKKSMGARHRGGIGLSYRPARLHRLAEFIPLNQFRGPINI